MILHNSPKNNSYWESFAKTQGSSVCFSRFSCRLRKRRGVWWTSSSIAKPPMEIERSSPEYSYTSRSLTDRNHNKNHQPSPNLTVLCHFGAIFYGLRFVLQYIYFFWKALQPNKLNTLTSWWLNQPIWKNMNQNGNLPQVYRVEHKKCLKPPPGIHPWRLTWNIIMEVWKISFLSKWVICMFHVNLPGCSWKHWRQSTYSKST